MKPMSMILKIVLLLSLCIPSTKIFAAGDDFCVTVEEKPSGTIIEANLVCANGHNGYTVPCFEIQDDGYGHINFDAGYNFNITPVPDETILELRAKIHFQDINGNPIYLPLSNAVSGQNYAAGTSDPVMDGGVALSIDLYFLPEEDVCLYYITFWVTNITPPSAGSSSSGNSGGISQGPTGGTSFMVPSMELEMPITLCEESCIISYPPYVPICIPSDGAPNDNGSDRISQGSVGDLSIYPNPTSDGNVVLDLDFGQSEAKEMNIQVLDTQGRMVFETNRSNAQSKQKLSLTDLAPGIYFVYVKAGSQQLYKKLVKQ